MKTKVVNIHYDKIYDVYIGRPSIWGNPYKIGINGTREEVLKKYREYILGSSKRFLLPDLKGKVLGCFCKPLACHGDVLIKLLEEIK